MRLRLFICWCLLWQISAFSQDICEGNLGSNIFIDGDFGFGEANTLANDPNIAPGYTYTPNGPPDDGLYTITNDMGEWSNLFPAWLPIKDNSGSDDGYMMVVNASYEPGIFYEQIIEGLCENTLYEFSADIINLIRSNVSDHILPNVDFLLDDVVVYSTGNIGQTEQWFKYGFTFTTDASQSEIKLTLRNNAPGGIGNDLALDNISFRPCGASSFIDISTEETIFVCVDDEPVTITADIKGAQGQEFSIFWQSSNDGIVWEDIGFMNESSIIHDVFIPGDYYYRYLSAANDINLENSKCRIISDAINIVVTPQIFEVFDTICQGEAYEFAGAMILEPGLYIDTLSSQYDCDSIVQLQLATIPNKGIMADISFKDPTCFGYTDGEINISNVTNFYNEYIVKIDDQEVSQVIPDLGAGIYLITIEDYYHCQSSLEVELIDPDDFTIELVEVPSIILGESIQLEYESSYAVENFSWSPPEIFSCNNCPNPEALPLNDGIIKVIAQNEDGCVAEDQFTIVVSNERSLHLPNIFTPNEDGINDEFFITTYKSSVEDILTFNVYNRWGGLVFSKNNLSLNDVEAMWDGKIGEKDAPVGVYTYLMKVLMINGNEVVLSGSITLIR